MAVEEYPHLFHPVADGAVDESVTVEVFQHRPGDLGRLVEWSGGEELFLNGGPVVLLPGRTRLARRLVGLGDFAVRDGDTLTAEPADGFYQRYTPITA